MSSNIFCKLANVSLRGIMENSNLYSPAIFMLHNTGDGKRLGQGNDGPEGQFQGDEGEGFAELVERGEELPEEEGEEEGKAGALDLLLTS